MGVEKLGMPLNTQKKGMGQVLNSLDDPIAGSGVNSKSSPGLFDGLVMGAVDPCSPHAGVLGQEGTLHHRDGMVRLFAGNRLAMLQG